MYNQHNFPWEVTNRKLVLFIPCFKRLDYLKTTLARFKTIAPREDWCVLAVNDAIHQDMTSLEQEHNLHWFTFEREPVERNGAMLRNFVIKRLQSEYIACRDPEICLEQSEGDDYISRLLELSGDVVYRPKFYTELQEHETQKIMRNPMGVELDKADVLRKWVVRNDNYEGTHWGLCCKTNRLVNMRGYDEDFIHGYGYEDVHLLKRLQKDNTEFIIDEEVTGFHIWHPMKRSFKKTINEHGRIYDNKMKNLKVIANEGREWGNG